MVGGQRMRSRVGNRAWNGTKEILDVSTTLRALILLMGLSKDEASPNSLVDPHFHRGRWCKSWVVCWCHELITPLPLYIIVDIHRWWMMDLVAAINTMLVGTDDACYLPPISQPISIVRLPWWETLIHFDVQSWHVFFLLIQPLIFWKQTGPSTSESKFCNARRLELFFLPGWLGGSISMLTLDGIGYTL